MTGPEVRDLGSGVYVRMHICRHSEDWSGALVGFLVRPDDPIPESCAAEANCCVGAISWCADCPGATWELRSLDPLHVEPSVACRSHHEHHGWIRDGRWVPA